MKSQIAVVDIVPSCMLEDRAVKFKCRGGAWYYPSKDGAKRSYASVMTTVKAAINPDNIFVDSLEYYVDGVGYTMYNVKGHGGTWRPVPIVCYKRDRVRG